MKPQKELYDDQRIRPLFRKSCELDSGKRRHAPDYLSGEDPNPLIIVQLFLRLHSEEQYPIRLRKWISRPKVRQGPLEEPGCRQKRQRQRDLTDGQGLAKDCSPRIAGGGGRITLES